MTNQGKVKEKGKEPRAAMATQRSRRATVATGTGKKFLKGWALSGPVRAMGFKKRSGEKQKSSRARGIFKVCAHCLYLDSDVPTPARIPAVTYGPVTLRGFSSVAYKVPSQLLEPKPMALQLLIREDLIERRKLKPLLSLRAATCSMKAFIMDAVSLLHIIS